MTTICMFTPFDAPAGMALAKALLGAGHGLTLVETAGAAPSGAATHWTDTPAVLAATRNADLVLYWTDARGEAPAGLTWMARLPGVLCIDGAGADAAVAMAAGQAAGVIASTSAPWLAGCTGPFQLLAGTTPQDWTEAIAAIGPQAMLALPLRAALRQFGAILDGWGGAQGLLETPAFGAPLDVLRSGHRFL